MEGVLDLDVKGFESLFKEYKYVFVDCYTPWCIPCQKLHPVIEELAKKYGNKMRFVKVNIDEHKSFAEGYGIKLVPHFLIFEEGKLIDKFDMTGLLGTISILTWAVKSKLKGEKLLENPPEEKVKRKIESRIRKYI